MGSKYTIASAPATVKVDVDATGDTVANLVKDDLKAMGHDLSRVVSFAIQGTDEAGSSRGALRYGAKARIPGITPSLYGYLAAGVALDENTGIGETFVRSVTGTVSTVFILYLR